MKTKVISTFLVLFTVLFLLPTVFFVSSSAEDNPSLRIYDNANLLTDDEKSTILTKLDIISNNHNCDVVIVTTNSFDGKTSTEYADDFYDYNNYRADGILLVINPSTRDWWISTKGFGITAFTDAGQEYLMNKVKKFISNDEYNNGFYNFADLCDDFLIKAKTGDPYDSHNLPKKFEHGKIIAIALIVGIIIGLIITMAFKSQLKTVKFQPKADDYIKKDSLVITKAQELFLYYRVSRSERAKSQSSSRGGSSTHTSSSGSTHGGSGGKY